ncbi:(5-formylfuran-3-yl)methyl phosphate transaminase [Gracilariopsis chorda]|uniref:(5-formylfuran-3-yl)methyl phosphate transaminase n=1 Tax=Gracilariopsis chorda TaxID=448386 RepID=A0A2V3J5Y0_9FLOR|nr:(5-formylfuran-3-yl)methyl phosphate transaminase [Gracilariopsis chorda]|eukprot:PXF49784.1 (5-formylfuran-3-yl)methyl phosphate transaminase [Gracilariopsis chorda]
MTLRPSKRASEVSPFIVMEVLRRANELEQKLQSEGAGKHQKVLRLEVGQPSTPPPQAVLDAVARASTSYTAALGIKELKEAISNHYASWYAVDVPCSAIAITTGSSGAFLAAFVSCFDADDRVAVAVPGYPCYRHVLRAVCAEVVEIAVDETTNFQPTVSQLQVEHDKKRLKGVVVASPSNPTGSVLSAEDLAALAKFCSENDIRLIVDEIYHGIGDAKHATAMALHKEIIVISSFSKYWCMTGFRVGWLATSDEELLSAVEKTLQNMCICAPSFSQHAAIAALSSECQPELAAHVKRYVNNQKVLADWLRRAGFEPFMPQGAFYLYARCREVLRRLEMKDSMQLCRTLLEQCHVACTPGVDFDVSRGNWYVRFSCCGSLADVTEAGERVLALVSKNTSTL